MNEHVNDQALNTYVTKAMAIALLAEREAKLDALIGEIETLQYIVDNPHCLVEMNDLLDVDGLSEMNSLLECSYD